MRPPSTERSNTEKVTPIEDDYFRRTKTIELPAYSVYPSEDTKKIVLKR